MRELSLREHFINDENIKAFEYFDLLNLLEEKKFRCINIDYETIFSYISYLIEKEIKPKEKIQINFEEDFDGNIEIEGYCSFDDEEEENFNIIYGLDFESLISNFNSSWHLIFDYFNFSLFFTGKLIFLDITQYDSSFMFCVDGKVEISDEFNAFLTKEKMLK
jgi:hypothetical protein